MNFNSLTLLILSAVMSWRNMMHAASIFPNGKGRMRITENVTESNSEQKVINLPNGFKPEAAPLHPLLYPFATETPSNQNMMSDNNQDWTPMMPPSIQQTTYIPVLQQRFSTVSTNPDEEGPAIESIVYGISKAEELPMHPLDIKDPTISTEFYKPQHDTENMEQFQNHNYGFISDLSSEPNNQYANRRADTSETIQEELNEKPDEHTIVENLENRQENSFAKLQVINVNITDPQLLAMAKQINHSAEKSVYPPNKSKTKNSKFQSETTNSHSQAVEAKNEERSNESKMWPIDFMSFTNDTSENIASEILASNFSYLDDHTYEVQQTLDGSDQTENVIPQIPFDITKLGQPYEQSNSTEDPRICVPLTVREISATSTDSTDLIQVERIYCFPLPAPELESSNENYSTEDSEITLTTTETTREEMSYNSAIVLYLSRLLFISTIALRLITLL